MYIGTVCYNESIRYFPIHNRHVFVKCHSLQVAGERLSYLLDVYFFTQEDIDLNSQVMLWPEKIRPIFEQSEAVSGFLDLNALQNQ